MKGVKGPEGRWIVVAEPAELQGSGSRYYRDALECYLNAFDAAFVAACDRSEFEFIQCLLRVRGAQDAGWDPYETTLRAIEALREVHETLENVEAARHLQLWIYGHIVEAAEPYELLANLLDVARGGRFLIDRFPRVRGTATRPGRLQTPGEKIAKIAESAAAAGIPQVSTPLREIWDRELRNAVFHADYSFHGSELRLLNPYRVYEMAGVLRTVNRALAYHDALASLNRGHRESYTEPVQLPVSAGFSQAPDEVATVMVKDGHGVIGLKDSLTPDQIAAGKVPCCIARFSPRDAMLRMQDPYRATFPAERRAEESR